MPRPASKTGPIASNTASMYREIMITQKGPGHGTQRPTTITAISRRPPETRAGRTGPHGQESDPADSRANDRAGQRAPAVPPRADLMRYRLAVARKTRIRIAQARGLMLYRGEGEPVLYPTTWRPGKP